MEDPATSVNMPRTAMRLLLVLPLAVSFCLLDCTPQFLSKDELLVRVGLERMPSPEKYPDDDALILYERTEIRLQADADGVRLVSEREYRRATLVLRNDDRFRKVMVPLAEHEELYHIDASTIRADGSMSYVPHNEFRTARTTVTDARAAMERKSVNFVFPDVEPGAVLEYSYVVRSKLLLPTSVWVFQHPIPNLRSEFTFQLPAAIAKRGHLMDPPLKVACRFYNHPGTEMVGGPSGDELATYSLAVHDVAPVRRESAVKSSGASVGHAVFSLRSWKSAEHVGEWYNRDLYRPRVSTFREVCPTADKLTTTAGSDKEALDRLYRLVQKIPYIEIDLGEGGIIPSRPQTVLDRNFGDCKDKSTLLVGLLRCAGVHAEPALLLTANKGVYDTDFPTFRFNHMIVRAQPGKGPPVWLDPTSLHHRAGELPWQCQGVKALVLDTGYGAALVETPVCPSEDNQIEMRVKVEMAPLGDKTVYDVQCVFSGEACFAVRDMLRELGTYEAKRYFVSKIDPSIRNPDVEDVAIEDDTKSASILRLRIRFTDYSEPGEGADAYVIPVNPIKVDDVAQWVAEERRRSPVFLGYKRKIVCDFTLSFNESKFVPKNVPGYVNEENEEFSFSSRAKTEQNLIQVTNSLETHTLRIPGTRYSAFRERLREIQGIRTRRLVLVDG